MFTSAGRLLSRCANGPQTSRPMMSTDLDWYDCDNDTLGHSFLARPHSATADGRMSPACHDCSNRDYTIASSTHLLHTNTPVTGSQQSSARERHERQRRHYIKNGVDEPRYDDNDLLERHRRWFRKERPFTPRTLQSTQVSY